MRRILNLLIWTLLLGGSAAAVQWTGHEPEDPLRLSVNGKPLPVVPRRIARHNPSLCRSCNLGTQPQWETR